MTDDTRLPSEDQEETLQGQLSLTPEQVTAEFAGTMASRPFLTALRVCC